VSALSLEERFWQKVDRRGYGECWPWLAAHGRYGQFRLQAGQLGVAKRCNRPAHCVAFALVYGRWPDPHGLHGCDFTLCCNALNPSHVHEGTQLQNVRECIERGRARLIQQQPGERNSLAKLTNEQARLIRVRYSGGGGLQRELALEFSVSQRTVSDLVRGRTYQDAGGPLMGEDQRFAVNRRRVIR